MWLQYLQVLQVGAVALIPLIGAWIAWQQVQIARVRLQFDLYGKCFAVFEAARGLIEEISQNGNISEAGLQAYRLGTADAVFLLNDELSKNLVELAKRAVVLPLLNSEMESLPVGSDRRVKLSETRGEKLAWFNSQGDKLVAHFEPFLKLDERKRRGDRVWR